MARASRPCRATTRATGSRCTRSPTRRALDVVDLVTDSAGRLALDALPRQLAGVDLLTFPVVASQRGVVQPAAAAVSVAHDAGVPVLLDLAQAAGQVPLTHLDADGYVGTARKWLRGPRGTGWLAAPPSAAARLEPAYPSLVGRDADGVGRLATGEASVAARVGLAVALEELAADADAVVRSNRRARRRTPGTASTESAAGRPKSPATSPPGS